MLSCGLFKKSRLKLGDLEGKGDEVKLKAEIDLGDRAVDDNFYKSIHRILKGIEYDIEDGFRSGNVTNDTGDVIGRFTLE